MIRESLFEGEHIMNGQLEKKSEYILEDNSVDVFFIRINCQIHTSAKW